MKPCCLFIRGLDQCLCSSGRYLKIKLKYMNISTNLHSLFMVRKLEGQSYWDPLTATNLEFCELLLLLDAVSLACLRRAEKLWVKPLKAMKAISAVRDLTVGPPLVVDQCLNCSFQCPKLLIVCICLEQFATHSPTTTPNTPPLP